MRWNPDGDAQAAAGFLPTEVERASIGLDQIFRDREAKSCSLRALVKASSGAQRLVPIAVRRCRVRHPRSLASEGPAPGAVESLTRRCATQGVLQQVPDHLFKIMMIHRDLMMGGDPKLELCLPAFRKAAEQPCEPFDRGRKLGLRQRDRRGVHGPQPRQRSQDLGIDPVQRLGRGRFCRSLAAELCNSLRRMAEGVFRAWARSAPWRRVRSNMSWLRARTRLHRLPRGHLIRIVRRIERFVRVPSSQDVLAQLRQGPQDSRGLEQRVAQPEQADKQEGYHERVADLRPFVGKSGLRVAATITVQGCQLEPDLLACKAQVSSPVRRAEEAQRRMSLRAAEYRSNRDREAMISPSGPETCQ